jgi:hypothetical protein
MLLGRASTRLRRADVFGAGPLWSPRQRSLQTEPMLNCVGGISSLVHRRRLPSPHPQIVRRRGIHSAEHVTFLHSATVPAGDDVWSERFLRRWRERPETGRRSESEDDLRLRRVKPSGQMFAGGIVQAVDSCDLINPRRLESSLRTSNIHQRSSCRQSFIGSTSSTLVHPVVLEGCLTFFAHTSRAL